MVSAIQSGTAAAQVLESTIAKQPQTQSSASSSASLKPDTVSISAQGHQMAAGDADRDGDSA